MAAGDPVAWGAADFRSRKRHMSSPSFLPPGSIKAEMPVTRFDISFFLERAAGADHTITLRPRPGKHLLEDFCHFCMDSLTPKHKYWLAKFVTERFRTPSVGNFCAGSDAAQQVMSTLTKVMAARLGVDKCEARHAFSSEIDGKKRNFLKAAYENDSFLFGDLKDLSSDRAQCYKRGKTVFVPKVSCVTGGYPCTDISSLNVHSQGARTTIADASLRTGSCFKGILDYLEKHGNLNGQHRLGDDDDELLWALLENIVALKVAKKCSNGEAAPSNLEVAQQLLLELGLWSMAIHTDPRLQMFKKDF